MRKPVHAATLDEVLMNIRDPRRWMDPAALVQLIVDNPSLRGFAYGYAAEFEFTKYLERLGTVISEHYKADDLLSLLSDPDLGKSLAKAVAADH